MVDITNEWNYHAGAQVQVAALGAPDLKIEINAIALPDLSRL